MREAVQGGSLIINTSRTRLGALAVCCFLSACDLVGVDNHNADNTPPAAPTGLQLTAPDPQHVQLQWTASPDADTAGYRVFRSDLSTMLASVTTTTYTDATVAPATMYGYFVVAFDDASPPNQSDPTPVVQIRTPSAADTVAPAVPANVKAVASGPTQVNLTWDASTDTGGSGLAGYRIFRNGNATPVATVAVANYSDINLTAGTAYMYVVRAFDGAGNVSAPSTPVSVTTPVPQDTTPPTVPGGLTATAQGAATITLNWMASTDASGIQRYEIQRDGVKISDAPGNATSFIDSTVSPSTTYTYAVRAIDGANNASAFSNTATATTGAASDTTPPTVPLGVAATANTSQSIVVTWLPSTDSGGSGLAGYRIFRDGSANPLTTVAATVLTFTDTGLAPTSTHSYVVRAFDGDGNVSAPSNSASATTPQDSTPPSVPGNVVATALTSTSVRINWSASADTGGSGLNGYRIYRDGVLKTTAAASATSFTDSTVAPSTTYAYRVSAIDNANNESAQSPAANVTTPADSTAPTVPANVRAVAAGPTQVNVTWDASTDTGGSGLAGYRIFRDGGATPIATVTVASYSDINLTAGTTYTYVIRAFDGAGNVSAPSTPVSATTPVPADTTPPTVPGSLTVTSVTETQVGLSWSASTDTGGSGLQGYRVIRNGAQIGTPTATNFTDTTVSVGVTYTYTVRAADNAGNVSADSNSVQATPQASAGSGLDSRPSNTTCLAPNQPTTNTSVTTQRVFPTLSFTEPIAMRQAPGEPNNWYIVEQPGTIQRFDATAANPTKTQWADLQGIVNDTSQEAGLLGIAFHPNYASNGRVFLSYTGAGASPFQSHISEFRRGANGLLDPTTERIFLRLDQPFDNHNGGNILFGPDGNLYIGFGDGGSGGDPGNRSQNRNLLFGKILRINVDGATPYTIPSDNPYAGNPLCSAGSGSASCPEIYAYGLRNPWRWSFDRAATEPDLWLADVGQDMWEEVDRIVNGGNYGWHIREGRHCFSPASNCPLTANGAPLIDPIAEYDHSIGASVTGGYVYRGSAIPSLIGRYVFADFETGRLMYLATNASGGYDRRDLIVSTGFNIATFAEDASGELYFTDYGGGLYKIVPGTGTITDTIPLDLINTGCVSLVDPKQPALGLIPYAPNAPFWSDGAAKDRWMALPNGQQITIGADGDWAFPNGTVLMKNFKLGNQLIETRLFMRHPDTGNWGGYTYQWNAAQTVATLIKGGLITHIPSPVNQDWIYPSEAQCLQCHTNAAGRSLGLETAQLNGSITYPQTGRTANQLTTLNAIGMFTTPLTQPPSALPAYPNPYGTTGTVADRARAWLHTNCSQCHRPTGGTPSNMDLRFSTAIGSTNTCNAAPNSGDLGLGGAARLIVPGNAANSLIYVRLSRRDLFQMPPLATNQVDTAGAALIQSWINSMSATCQ